MIPPPQLFSSALHKPGLVAQSNFRSDRPPLPSSNPNPTHLITILPSRHPIPSHSPSHLWQSVYPPPRVLRSLNSGLDEPVAEITQVCDEGDTVRDEGRGESEG
ncbi:hypothetical protein QCA50_011244 [Cerrena zonata]|uniref:Uncharacterized protein n=1 Tax=Cerrena zonata TaxID=2478898 RepID=A0AAW0G6T5_9APHY